MSVDTFPARPESAPAPPKRLPLHARLRPLTDGSLQLSRTFAFALVALLVLASLALRLRGLHAFYWVDEGLSVEIASHPLRHIPALLRQDGSPPLYYLLLHVWMALRGRSEVDTHELSLIFALLSVPAAYWAGSSLFDRRHGLVAAVLAAAVPYLSMYGEETRMYSLLALLAILVAASFVHAFVFGRRRYLPVFAVSLAAALYTHNWSLFLAAVCLLMFLACVYRAPVGDRRALWRDGALAFGGAAVLYAPWLPTLVYQAGHTGAPWDLPPVIWSLTQGSYSLVGGRGAAVAILLGAGSGLWALRRLGPAGARVQLAAISLLVLGFGTLLVAWAYSKVTPAWAFRYLAVIVGPLLLAAALGIIRARPLGLVALVLVLGFWVLDPVPHSRNWKSNVASVAAHVRPQLDPGSLVVATQPEQIPTLAYYLPQVHQFGSPMGRTPDPGVVDWRSALERLKRGSVRATLAPMVASLPAGERLLLVVSTNLEKQPLWMKLINRDGKHWTYALEHSSSMRLLRIVGAGSHSAGVAVKGYLFVKA